MGEPTFASRVGDMLADVYNLIDAAFGWVGDFLLSITEYPLLFIFVVAVPLVGLGVGLLNRLIRAN